jgi:hypothetical protein
MKNSKLVEEAKRNPGRIYHRPHDVLRDRRLDDAARIEILTAWAASLAEDSTETAQLQRDELQAALHELDQRGPQQQAAE